MKSRETKRKAGIVRSQDAKSQAPSLSNTLDVTKVVIEVVYTAASLSIAREIRFWFGRKEQHDEYNGGLNARLGNPTMQSISRQPTHGQRTMAEDATWHMARLPSALLLHHARRDGRWRAGQCHPGVGIDDRDNFARARRGRLLVIHLVQITGNTGMNVRVGRNRRQGDGRSGLWDRLNLVLERRGLGRSAG